jgi:hypothetical protein
VATVDPDNLIAKKGLGRVGTSVAELATGIREILDSPHQWQVASQAARKYYAENHALDVAMGRFERVFREVAGASTTPNTGERA